MNAMFGRKFMIFTLGQCIFSLIFVTFLVQCANRGEIWRSHLPAAMIPNNEVGIWAVLKNCIGKDLSKITMPVMLNEPLSFLQRLCEYMEYAELLTLASKQEDVVNRMKFVASFAVSALASNWQRLGKPFNPLQGETYELQRNDYKVVCEQVSHHPPVSAFHAESPNFKFHGSIHPKLKFWGKSVEIQPKGQVTIELPKWNEAYTWSNVNCCIHNVIVGKLWIEQYGTMDIVNHKTGHRAVLNFKTADCSSKDLHRVEGFVQDKNKKNIYFLYGNWIEFMKCSTNDSYEEYIKTNFPKTNPKKVISKLNSSFIHSFRSLSIQDNENDPPQEIVGDIPHSEPDSSFDIPGSILTWKCYPRPKNSAQYFQFTNFAMQLNEMEPNMKPPISLCPTDSRLRPDVMCLEKGDLDGACKEKTRLEEKQRDAKRLRKDKNKEIWKPRWFTNAKNPYTEKEDWLYTGGYWDRNYAEVDEIF